MKKGRNYEHWILWMLYNNNVCKWRDFLSEPLSINQSSLSKVIKIMLKEELIRKDDDKKEYSITQLGKNNYSKMLELYKLDKQTILEEESKRIEDLTKETVKFFEKYKIEQKDIQFRFLNNKLKLGYDRVNSILKSEEEYNKILLFIAMNHPFRYPNQISPSTFSKEYDIKENTLTYYVDEIVESDIYPINFFKLSPSSDNSFYFQEEEKLETMIRAICESYIKEFTYINKLYKNSKSIHLIIDDIIEEICTILLNEGLKEALQEFIPDYLKYLAYKIEMVEELKESYDKLEGLIWQNMINIFNSKKSKGREDQYRKELENINSAIELNRNNIELYYDKLKILIYFSDYDEILKFLEEMIEIFPTQEIEIKMKKASVLKRMKNLHEGLKIINKLLVKYPKNNDLRVYKAYWLQYLNKKEESIETIKDLIESNPNNGSYYDTFGEILMYFEVYDESIKRFLRALELAGNKWFVYQTYIKLGICYKELRNYGMAIKNLKKGIKLTKESPVEEDLKQNWLKMADLFINEIKLGNPEI
jgi:tetratricopeptide (TPR) repeat protein